MRNNIRILVCIFLFLSLSGCVMNERPFHSLEQDHFGGHTPDGQSIIIKPNGEILVR